jgi:ubiquinone biosynthesis protein COQ9
MSHDEARDKILLAMMPHVIFDGWSRRSLAAGVEDAGYSPDMALRAFPGGLRDVAEHFASHMDQQMLTELTHYKLANMKIRERIATCVRVRLQLFTPYREAVRRLVSFLALPTNAPLALRCAWRTCSVMWYAAGDTSADFNYYTKRGLLTPVYTTTLLYWLNDDSGNFEKTWGFLDRRIADVLKIPMCKAKLKEAVSKFPSPFKLIQAVRGRA